MESGYLREKKKIVYLSKGRVSFRRERDSLREERRRMCVNGREKEK